jgi:3',5'-cyclic AMP phosphodiesterase CpdA
MTKPYRIVQISDPHLSADRAYYQENWEITLEWLDVEKPDLVIVTGDVSINDPDRIDDLHFARRQLERITVPWRAIPGNHDVGDNIVSGKMNKRVTSERRDRWLDIFGPDWWAVEAGGWSIIGINSLILNSEGLKAEAEQADWLASTCASVTDGRPMALVLHKPLFLDHPSEATLCAEACDPAARQAVLAPFAGKSLKLVASGHQHQYRSFNLDGVVHLWAPSVAVINKPPNVMMYGRRDVGFIDLRLERGGQLRQRLVGSDFLFRNESYIRVMEYGNTMMAPRQPLKTTSLSEAAE